ncbi:Plastid-lipid-associated protein 6, chloroplastic-like protein [Drosera capensis]
MTQHNHSSPMLRPQTEKECASLLQIPTTQIPNPKPNTLHTTKNPPHYTLPWLPFLSPAHHNRHFYLLQSLALPLPPHLLRPFFFSTAETLLVRIVGPILAVDGATSVLDPSQDFSELLASLKLKLLSSVSGLNRGLAATEEDIKKADDAAKELEAVGGPVDLSVNIDKLQGKWKLISSSSLSSCTFGGSRPGPPTGRLLPITLGQVFQRSDTVSKDFDNIVELELGAPWPFLRDLVRIKFQKTTVKSYGNLSQLPPLEIPRIPDALQPPSNTRSGEFEVTYIDSDSRITRGERRAQSIRNCMNCLNH